MLETTLGGKSIAGGKMKEAGTLNWPSPNTGGNNNSGFAGLPGGYRSFEGTFTHVASYGGWWSATSTTGGYTEGAWFRFLENVNGKIGYGGDFKSCGKSVRCVRD